MTTGSDSLSNREQDAPQATQAIDAGSGAWQGEGGADFAVAARVGASCPMFPLTSFTWGLRNEIDA